MATKESAEDLFRKAVEIHSQGRFADALTQYGAVIRLAPDMAAAHSNRAAVLIMLRQFEPALRSADRALALHDSLADAWSNRGNALEGLGRVEEGLASYDRALALRPDFAIAHNNRGNVLRALSRQAEALDSYDRALALAPDYVEAHYNRGITLKELQRPDDAIASFDTAIGLRQDYVEAHNNRGNALQDVERFEEALASYDRALAFRPGHLEALNNRGITLRYLKRLDEAIVSFDRALALAPAFADARWNRALCLLQAGRLVEGWREYEWRLKRADRNVPRPLPEKLWKGEDIAGKTLLVLSEQGLGDTIQFCRYASLAAARGAHVVLSVQEKLVRLVRTFGPSVEVIGETALRPEFDYCTPLLSLPRFLGESFAAQIPYLQAEDEKVRVWRDRIGNDGFKVGICWQGEKDAIVDVGRSFPLRLFDGVAKLPGVRLISLQKFAGAEQLADLPDGMKVETLGEEFDAGPDAFIDSAAVIESLDLVITGDTAIAHLAGALGRPAWLALKQVPDWRWFLDAPDTPWYPTMRLFRQRKRGDWASVFSEMESQLRETMTKRPAPLAPLSWGELIDRFVILEIKAARIQGASAQANVAKELEAVRKIAAPGLGEVTALAAKLKTINEELWDIENRIRAKEAAKSFDDEFVAFARAIYTKNDARARLKREISLALGSELMEEKRYTS